MTLQTDKEKQLKQYLVKAKKNNWWVSLKNLQKDFNLPKEKVRYWIEYIYGSL